MLASPEALDVAPEDAYEGMTPFQRDFNIYWDFVSFGMDHFRATRSIPNFAMLKTHYLSGTLDHAPEELMRILRDEELNDEYEVYKLAVEEELDKEAQLDELLKNHAHNRASFDRLPPALFQKVKWQKDTLSGKPQLTAIEGEIDDTSKEMRVNRYLLAKRLLAGRSTGPPNMDKLVEVVVGINPRTGVVSTGSFAGRICKANPALSPKEVRLAAHGAWEDSIFPETKEALHRQIAEAADTTIRPISAYYDTATGKRLVGTKEKAVYLRDRPEAKPHIQKLGELLLADNIDIDFGRRGQFRKMEKPEYIKYGKFLLGVLQPYQETLTLDVLMRGYQLGIGPHPEGFRRHFGTVVDYFQVLSEILQAHVGKNRRGMFDGWELEDFVAHLKRVAAENDGVVTMRILKDRINKGANEPAPDVYDSRGGLNPMLEAAGLPLFSKTYDADECIQVGLRFALENNGKAPSEVDMKRTSYLPSDYLIRKHFGKVSTYRELVRQAFARQGRIAESGTIHEDELLAA